MVSRLIDCHALETHLTEGSLYSLLTLLRWYLRLNTSFRRNIDFKAPGTARRTYEAIFHFIATDGTCALSASFGSGSLRLRKGLHGTADATFEYRDGATLRSTLLKKPHEVLELLLSGELVLRGNLNHSSRFSYMLSELSHRLDPSRLLRRNAPARPPGDVPLHEDRTRELLSSVPRDRVELLDEQYLSRFRLEDFPRLERIKQRIFATRPAVCIERAELVTAYHRTHGFPDEAVGRGEAALRQARMLEYVLGKRQALIAEDSLLAGTTTTKTVGVVLYPEFSAGLLWPELLTVGTRELNPYELSAQDAEKLNLEILPYWMEATVRETCRKTYGAPLCQRLDERFALYFLWKTVAVSHTVVDYPRILARGLSGLVDDLRERLAGVEDSSSREYLQAMLVALGAVQNYVLNLAAQARRLAEKEEDPQRWEELMRLTRILGRVPAQPSRTLDEAVNALWVTFVALHLENTNAGLSWGRLDHWLQPYFLADLEPLREAAEREAYVRHAVELISCLFLCCADHVPMVPNLGNTLFGGSSSDMAITLGGVDAQGRTAVCDMTYVFLKVTELLALRDPNVNARYHPEVNSKAYLRRLCEVNAITHATPSIHNDKAVLEALTANGFPLEDARDFCATGCVEPTLAGRHMGHTNCMLVNTVAPLEMVLHDGVHPLLGSRVGPDPGPLGAHRSFDSLLHSYLEQLAWVLDQAVEYNDLLGKTHQRLHPTPLLSAFIRGPETSCKDVLDGGALFNSSGVALVALPDVIDSLVALEFVVFEQKFCDLSTLRRALDEDFVGHEVLHARILRQVPKFGQDRPAVNRLADELLAFIHRHLTGKTNYRGGAYLPGYWSMSNHVAFGRLSGALPSGRKRGKAFTPGITPSPMAGGDFLDNIRGVARLDPRLLPNNVAFNVKIVPDEGVGHAASVDLLTAYAGAYFELGGMQLQFNVVSTETLRRAMEEPDAYRWLIVRISGYNAYFVDLNRDLQMELIERYEQSC